MPITELPTPPSRSDPVNFATRGDAFMAAFPVFRTEANALEANVNAKEASAVTKAAEGAASATAAAGSATNSETSRVGADKRYLGAKATAPTLDNQGAALLTGALYWDTALVVLRVYNGTAWVNTPATAATGITNTPAGNIAATTVQSALNELDAEKPYKGHFYKLDTDSVAFTKTGAGTISIKAGTTLTVAATLLTFALATAVVMPALAAGTDYAIYACTDGTLRADASVNFPTGYTLANSSKIGGFHYGLVAPGTTVVGGAFTVDINSMMWSQFDVDKLAGINLYSLWDLKFRPACRNPRGMVLVADSFWADIYLCNTDTAANGTSKFNTNVASGTVLPKIPTEFGGWGFVDYTNGNWWTFNEIARANGKRLPCEAEFVAAAFGVTEGQSLGGAASTIPSTARQAGYTSKYGLEQASGHIWTWGADSSTRWDGLATPWNWRNVNGGRGQVYLYGDSNLVRVLLGGSRSYAASSGSRASSWGNFPWDSSGSIGLRAFADHLKLA